MIPAWPIAESGTCASVNVNVTKHFNAHKNLKTIIDQIKWLLIKVIKLHDMNFTYMCK